MNRIDLQKLSALRLREARILFAGGEYSGAYYLAGYSVECALKACIAKDTQKHDFPNRQRTNSSYTHKPDELLKVANLFNLFEQESQSNPRLKASWIVVNNWSEQSRYKIWNKADADAMIDAVGRRQDGVLPWIKLRW
jgi:HEPN domain-containing protein